MMMVLWCCVFFIVLCVCVYLRDTDKIEMLFQLYYHW